MTCLASLYDIPVADRANVIELAAVRKRLDDEEILRHTLLRRLANKPVSPATFVVAVNVAIQAREGGANMEQSLQAAVKFANANSPRAPLDAA